MLAIKLGLVLLLGAATTVATSWLLVLQPAERWFDAKSTGLGCPSSVVYLQDRAAVYVTFREGVGWLTVRSKLALDRGSFSKDQWEDVRLSNSTSEYSIRKTGAWARLNDRMSEPLRNRWDHSLQYAFGWPDLALTFEWYIPAGTNLRQSWEAAELHGGLRLAASTPPTHHRSALPLKPRWSGFTINTALYATAWAVLYFTGGFAVRQLRRPAGACRRCGYLSHGLTEPGCPECGLGRQ